MAFEQTVGLIALAWLIGAFALMAWSTQRGRALAKTLSHNHPDLYLSLGKPLPGYFESARRRRFAQFVGQREFEQLPDPRLVAEFRAHMKFERNVLLTILASLVPIALLIITVHFAT